MRLKGSWIDDSVLTPDTELNLNVQPLLTLVCLFEAYSEMILLSVSRENRYICLHCLLPFLLEDEIFSARKDTSEEF